jgi:exodeoxyribonuclease-3
VAHEEIDLKNPGPNRGNAGFSDEERGSFTSLLNAGFTDTFRACHPALTGAYSWWSYRMRARERNAGWRIDYFLVSNAIANRVSDASILDDVYGSDHCPVGLEIKL